MSVGDLDTYLKSRTDRCPGCGYHPETQGHQPDCPPHRWSPAGGYCFRTDTGEILLRNEAVIAANEAAATRQPSDGPKTLNELWGSRQPPAEAES